MRGGRPGPLMRRVMTAGGLLVLAVVALAVLTVVAEAQPTSSPVRPGPFSVNAPNNLTIAKGETLTVGAGTYFTGNGSVHVFGSLTVNGTPDLTTNFSIPLYVYPGGLLEMSHVKLGFVHGTALLLAGGSARLDHALFQGNSQAIWVDGNASLVVLNSSFGDHSDEALYVADGGDIRMTGSTFTGNGRGISLYSVEHFELTDSTFRENSQHLVVDLGPWSTAGEIIVERNEFGAPSSTPAELPGIFLRHDPPLADEPAQRTIRLASNRIEGAPVGIRAEGRGLVVLSSNDTLVDNDIGLSVQLATVRVEGGTFGNERDIEGSGRVTLDGVTYLRSGALNVDPGAALPSWTPWALGAAVVIVGAAALLVPRLARPRAPEPAPAPLPPLPEAAPPTVRPIPVATVDVATPLTSVERRILEDIRSHVGTPQRAVAERLGMTRQALHYHVKKLEARGLVHKVVEGRETRCSVPAHAAAVLASAPTRTESHEKA